MEQELIKPSVDTNDVTFGEWLLTLFLAAIPLVGIILLFVWAFGTSAKPSKANWAKAGLAWAAIVFVAYVLIVVVVVIVGIMASKY